ncbi:hypothetical protein SteCoe_26923 [Stentor coeruleus]|uniref:sphinganine-1-phosphate aldolase n=1 Tax=Stentor coeruleus TaxID=5963 RepID=A0A1R2BBP3_9CILI|nr:hypothetical protein SteCoe_26923 [Stentor coeruleus]
MLRKLRVERLKDERVVLILSTITGTLLFQKVVKLFRLFRRQGIKPVISTFFTRLMMRFKFVQEKIDKEDSKAKELFQKHFDEITDNKIEVIPEQGSLEYLQILKNRSEQDAKSHCENRISGSIYHHEGYILNLSAEAMKYYTHANPLHPEIFPSVRQMECEIVQMCLNMFNGPSGSCGTITSGGTESLLLAMLAYREWGRKKGISDPEVIVSETVHAAIDKAAFYFNMNLIQLKVDKTTGKLNPSQVKSYINSRTVAVFGSAPNYPHGNFDPLEELGQLALRYKINFHIDACLGSFLLPFAKDAGFDIPLCDFRVQGVTSISCDPHKYGYTPKGISIIMYKTSELRRFQYFSCPEWTGGLYATPTIAGSRPGVISAGAWAVITSMGKNGYVECTKKILSASRFIIENTQLPELKIIGQPLLSIIAFTSETLNPHAIGDNLSKIGKWKIDFLQNPPAFHFCVTMANADQAENFVEDLKKAVERVKNDPEAGKSETVALYGAIAKMPDKGIVGNLFLHYVDCLFSFN